jgi:hypothetical protein
MGVTIEVVTAVFMQYAVHAVKKKFGIGLRNKLSVPSS